MIDNPVYLSDLGTVSDSQSVCLPVFFLLFLEGTSGINAEVLKSVL